MKHHSAQTYARCLFEVAVDRGLMESVGDDLEMLRVLVVEEPQVLIYLDSPCFTLSQKHGFIIRSFGAEIQDLTHHFLALLFERRRIGLFPEIVKRYRELRDRVEGCRYVRVVVAQPLSCERLQNLEAEISGALQRPIRMEVETDPSLLGGILIRCDDERIDNSLRGRLSRAVKTLNAQIKSVTYEG